MEKLKKCLRKTDFKSQKVIDDFKRYVESFYLDFINEEMIDEYILDNIDKNEVYSSTDTLPF